MEGKVINGFELKRLLGVGGMAEVWYAENEIGMKAAVKVISERLSHDDQMQERFLNEAKVMVMLDHPNIRKVYGYGNIDGRPAIIMEYLNGSDLKARMKNGQRFTNEELEKWWNQLADALNYTHAQEVVHRDIKPSNIFIDQHGNAKLLDFGIAKVTDTTSGTLTGSTLGTRIYMSPEQVRDPKRVGIASDVYSLAVSFVHLLTGTPPYDSTNSSDFDIQLSIVTKPVDLSKVPVAWQCFLEPYLEKDPDNRPALCSFAKESLMPRNLSSQSVDNEENRLLMEENRLLREQLERMVAEQKVKKDYNSIGIGEVEEETVADNVSKEGGLVFNIKGVSFIMKRVEGGTFWMGAHARYIRKGLFSKEADRSIPNFDSEANLDEQPVHRVTISSFYMGETEVTQALWKAVMGTEPTYKDGWTNEYGKGDCFPTYRVSFDDIMNGFLPKLNKMCGKTFRLPTEAEWEYAARGGKDGTGCRFAGGSNIEKVAWFWDYNTRRTHEVKTKLPNELGLYDMSGNVCEWCLDWYGNYSSSSQTNPKGPLSGSEHVIRGGSWTNIANECRVCYRGKNVPEFRGNYIGFRLVLSQETFR